MAGARSASAYSLLPGQAAAQPPRRIGDNADRFHASPDMQIHALYEYPLKSAAARPVDRLELAPRGPANDRRWMVVDPDGGFLTGRQLPRMVLLRAEPGDGGLRLAAPGMPALSVAVPAPDAPRQRVTVWKDQVDASLAGEQADAWLSRFLGRPARLVHMDPAARRPLKPAYAQPGDEVSFADGFPLLLISQASLDALNARLARPIPMTRFRPNLVVSGCAPHAEDGWRRLRIGGIEMEVAKPCVRCVFTTVDPATGERDPDGEPLRTLKEYRRGESGITFGVNLIARGSGVVRVGDECREC